MMRDPAATMGRRERALTSGTIVLAGPPLLVLWSLTSQAVDPSALLLLLVAIVIPAAAGTLAWVWRRSRVGRFVAPLAVLLVLIGISNLASSIGERQVLAFCSGLLRSPRTAEVDMDEVVALSTTFEPECRVLDVTWGLWELEIQSRGRRVGYIGILPGEAGFRLDSARRDVEAGIRSGHPT